MLILFALEIELTLHYVAVLNQLLMLAQNIVNNVLMNVKHANTLIITVHPANIQIKLQTHRDNADAL